MIFNKKETEKNRVSVQTCERIEEVLSASLDLLEGVEGPAPPVPGSEVFKSNMA